MNDNHITTESKPEKPKGFEIQGVKWQKLSFKDNNPQIKYLYDAASILSKLSIIKTNV